MTHTFTHFHTLPGLSLMELTWYILFFVFVVFLLQITSLEVVQHLSTLQSLNVSHTNISSLAPLQNHPALTSLSMFSTDVTDAGLRHLQG